jgi:hypothetical protein
MATDQFLIPIPQAFLDGSLDNKTGELGEWARTIHLLLDQITAANGAIATGEATTEVVLTQQEKLDKITVTQDVNLDDMESDIDLIATGEPAYVIVGDTTKRFLNADEASAAVSATYVQAEAQAEKDARLNLADVTSTMQKDLAAKGILG